MQRKINFTQVICLRMGKTTKAKLNQVNLRSSLQRIHYYQLQTVTSMRNLIKPFDLFRNTNLQLNLFPNTQLDLYCSGNLSVQCTDPSTWLTHQLKKDCWLQNSSIHQQWKSGNSLVTKRLAKRRNSFYRENDELEQFLPPVTIYMYYHFASPCDGF